MQTNGTLLTDEWGEFLKENDFLVGISIDGPPEMHDAYRVDKGGKPTFDRVMRGLDVLKRHGVDWNVLTTIHAVNGDHGREVYRFLRDELGATFIQYIPIIERATPETLPIADAGWGAGARPPAVRAGRVAGHPPLGRPGAVRPVPDRRVRGMGAPRHRDRVRADVRHRAGQLVRRAGAGCACTPRPAASSWRWSTTATCTPATTTSNRGYLLGNIKDKRPAGPGRLAAAAASSGRTSATPSPGSAGTAMCGSPATAAAPRTGSRPPRTANRASITCAPAISRSSATSEADAGHGPLLAPTGARRAHGALRAAGRPPRPERPVHLRQRPQVEAAATAPDQPAGSLCAGARGSR